MPTRAAILRHVSVLASLLGTLLIGLGVLGSLLVLWLTEDTATALRHAHHLPDGHAVHVLLDEGRDLSLWVRDQDPARANCQVVAPAGQTPATVTGGWWTSALSVDVDGNTYHRVSTAEASTTGSHLLRCDGADAYAIESDGDDASTRLGILLLGCAAVVPGFLLTLPEILLRRRDRRREAIRTDST